MLFDPRFIPFKRNFEKDLVDQNNLEFLFGLVFFFFPQQFLDSLKLKYYYYNFSLKLGKISHYLMHFDDRKIKHDLYLLNKQLYYFQLQYQNKMNHNVLLLQQNILLYNHLL